MDTPGKLAILEGHGHLIVERFRMEEIGAVSPAIRWCAELTRFEDGEMVAVRWGHDKTEVIEKLFEELQEMMWHMCVMIETKRELSHG